MKRKKFTTALLLFILGMMGIFSMLTIEIPLDPNVKELLEIQFSAIQIKFILLINPTLLLMMAIAAGIFVYDKVNLKLVFIDAIVYKDRLSDVLNILKLAVIGGIIAGTIMILISTAYNNFLPNELSELGKDVKPSVLMRLLYGGLTEEILMRFGLMTLIVWLTSFISGKRSKTYWIGIILSAIIFGLGHFPIVFQSIENPSLLLLSYIILGNSVGGIIFGWLYWKKGLESAMIAHIFAHITMLTGEYLVNII